ncbi:MAG: hypothetical protein A2275_04680 [Bacteroidetes bacterium RIFOXYA12_FULL_35_11]|nr:MAG: hypothetical protein A2X01_05660 [Bacteroidetes bacterium GWF2_35_48]OFY76682.1 MAG: hypothetical protein A2275_04680 [Bacteroidetes bacterium RIFOXYA12_FULL_35_11]HBX52242.1 hypothetical protein [Bacteroidales bacterium]
MLLPVIAYFTLQNSSVQTYLTNRVSKFFLEEFNAKLTVSKIDISFINSVVFEKVFIQDTHQDTLVYMNRLEAQIKKFGPFTQVVELDKIIIDNLYANIYEDSSLVMNFQFLIDAFASKEEKKKKDTTKSELRFSCENIDIKNSHFKYKMYNVPDQKNGMNFDDLHFFDFNLSLQNFQMQNDSILLKLENLSIKEKSGLQLDTLATWVLFTPQNLSFIRLALHTPNTDLRVPFLSLAYDSLGDFSDFLNKITINAKIEPSSFGADDLAYVVTDLWGINQKIDISGNLTGKVCDLTAKDLKLKYGNKTIFYSDFHISGLPDPDKIEMDVQVHHLLTDNNDLSKISLPPFNEKHPLPLPEQLKLLGNISFAGNISGSLNDLAANGKLITGIGAVIADLTVINDTNKKQMVVEGKIQTQELNVGRLAENEATIGTANTNLSVRAVIGNNNKIKASIQGEISSVRLLDYTYQNITLDASIDDKKVDSKISIRDPSLTLDLTAKGVLDKKASIFTTLDIDRADLFRLKFNTTDSMCLVSAKLFADITGSNVDDLAGKLTLEKVYYANQNGSISMQDFVLDMNDYFTYKKISLTSDLIDVSIAGKYKIFSLIDALVGLGYKYFPSISPVGYVAAKDTIVNDINFDIKIKKTDELCKLFAPDITLSPKTQIAGTFNSQTENLNFKGTVPVFSSGENKITNLYLDAFTENKILSINIEGNKIDAGTSLSLEHLNINADIRNDSVLLYVNNLNKEAEVYGIDFSCLVYMKKETGKKMPLIHLEILPSQIFVSDNIWNLSPSKIHIDTTAIQIENFKLENKYQSVAINGKVSNNPDDTLSVYFKKFDLAFLNTFTGDGGPQLTGRLDGTAGVNDVYNKLLFATDISIKNFTLNQEMLGNTFVKSHWNEETKNINLQVYTKIGKVKTLSISGDYSPTNHQIAFEINLNRLKLNILQPYLTGIVSDLKGEVNGNFSIVGTTEKPLIEGTLDILDTYFILDFSKVRYNIKNSITITNNEFKFEDFNIFDPNWKMLVLNGNIMHNNFENIRLDLTMKTTDDAFMFLNTEESDNESFYGTAYMTGVFKIAGKPENIVVDISARTEKDTYFYIPLTSTSDLQENDFITFVNKNAVKDSIEKVENTTISGVTLNFDLDITPDAEAQIIFDQKTGDLIKGRGTSNLKIEINTLGKFNMYGDFIIDRGDYLFTLQNIINKRFDVEKGGYISWNGDPLDATVDLKAVYKLKTALYDLVLDTSEQYKKRSSVECLLSMTNKLMEPVIGFDINLPTADEKSKSVLTSLSADEKNKQFLSLLVLNRFMTPESMKGSVANDAKRSSVGGVTSSELLSNQLSHWLSQISNDFDIGVNYRPGDEISSDQVEVALSTQILNDRVSINGNVGIGQQKGTSSGIAGDFDVSYKITKNGKLRVKAFAKANDNDVANSAPYTQGFGLFYRHDFNKWSDLFMRKKE